MHVSEVTLSTFGVSQFYDDALDRRRRKEELGKGFDVCGGSMSHDVRREGRFDLAFPNEEDDRLEDFVRQPEVLG